MGLCYAGSFVGPNGGMGNGVMNYVGMTGCRHVLVVARSMQEFMREGLRLDERRGCLCGRDEGFVLACVRVRMLRKRGGGGAILGGFRRIVGMR